MRQIKIEWEYDSIWDSGYGDQDLICQVECTLNIDNHDNVINCSITDFQAWAIDQDGGEEECCYEPDMIEETELMTEALNRYNEKLYKQ